MTVATGTVDLRNIINEEQPFGPASSDSLHGDRLGKLLVRANPAFLTTKSSRPAVVVGRRGSGKTALLRSPYTHNGATVIELDASTALSAVTRAIKAFESRGHGVSQSISMRMWDSALWCAVFREMIDQDTGFSGQSANVEVISEFLKGLAPNYRSMVPGALIDAYCSKVVRDDELSPDHLQFVAGNRCDFQHANSAAKNLLDASGRDVLVLIDSMDDYDRAIVAHPMAITGLLAVASERRRVDEHYSIRLCIPAEIRSGFERLSSNILKDFEHELTIEWTASQIVQILASRIYSFFTGWRPDTLTGIARRLGTSSDASDFPSKVLRSILPHEMKNSLGTHEDPLAYILRHTQLLPRHAILIMNNIWTKHIASKSQGLPILESAIREGVHVAERKIVKEICAAYSQPYPALNDVCTVVIPNLSLRFCQKELNRICGRNARRYMPRSDVLDIRKMLIATGVVGYLTEDHPRYVNASFAYYAPGEPAVAEAEELCLHPIFAGAYRSPETRGELAETTKPVYPHGIPVTWE